MTLRALTVRSPWAWAISIGAKPTENRAWTTRYRGPLAIHAGARSRWDRAGEESPLIRAEWAAIMGAGVPLDRHTELIPFGAVVAVAILAGVHHDSACKGGCSEWAADGQYHFGLASMRPLGRPVPAGGALGLWPLPDDAESAVLAQAIVDTAAVAKEADRPGTHRMKRRRNGNG